MTQNDTSIDAGQPKLFISYCWTDPIHMDWVIQLATDLRTNGVNAILDKWHLREGQDAHAFMEKMVTDKAVEKVILVCDRKYVERSDQREGGVGAESQIMSGELYGKVDQTKFVAICRENDENGRALLPAFMRSRIYIDMTTDADYSQRFEQVIRWCFDKPFYVEPEMGRPPAFLDEQAGAIIREVSKFERATVGGTSSGAAINFLRAASKSSSDFTVLFTSDDNKDDEIFQSILGLSPNLSRILEVIEDFIISENGEFSGIINELHTHLEAILSNYENGPTQWSGDVTRFYGQFMFVAIVAIFARNRRFNELNEFLDMPFILDNYEKITAKSIRYTRFNQYLRSLEARNSRLQLRRLSLHSDLIKQVCEISGIDFRDFMQADLILFIRNIVNDLGDSWWPDSLLYAADKDGAFPWFLRAAAGKALLPFLSVMGITSKSQLQGLIDSLRSGRIKNPEWQGAFNRVDVVSLANLPGLMTRLE